MMPRLDWRDPAAVRAFLTELRATLDDAHAVVGDMLSPPRTRELGPALHRRQYREARAKIGQLLALAMPGPRDPRAGRSCGLRRGRAHRLPFRPDRRRHTSHNHAPPLGGEPSHHCVATAPLPQASPALPRGAGLKKHGPSRTMSARPVLSLSVRDYLRCLWTGDGRHGGARLGNRGRFGSRHGTGPCRCSRFGDGASFFSGPAIRVGRLSSTKWLRMAQSSCEALQSADFVGTLSPCLVAGGPLPGSAGTLQGRLMTNRPRCPPRCAANAARGGLEIFHAVRLPGSMATKIGPAE
jgi:hypothetical protein